VFAGSGFQEGLRNYRDLKLMGRMLGQWSTSMDAFQEMIAARRRAFAERLPKVDALLTSGQLQSLQKNRTALAGRLEQVAATRDVAALAPPDQAAQWARVQRDEAMLAHDPDTPAYAKLREHLAMVRGVLLYQMDQEFAARLWSERKALRGLDVGLVRAQQGWTQLETGRQALPVETGGFAERVIALRQRLGALQLRLAAAETAQGYALAELAVADLEQQKVRLQGYRVQAQFALATIYDQAAHTGGNSKTTAVSPGPVASPGGSRP
jgi:hypothetical protein